MNKYIKTALLLALGLSVIVAALLAYVAATFNPNDYKSQIIQAVKESKQRNLLLDGDIKLSFFPSIGAKLNRVSLSEFNSDKEFAALESAHVSLALLPLLRKQVVVDEITLNGLKATLVKHKDGSSNIDDLLGKPDKTHSTIKSGQAQPVGFDIGAVSISNTNLMYRDDGMGANYAIKDLNLKTGRIAAGVPSKIVFSAEIQSNKPKLDIRAQFNTTLTFDLDKQSYLLEEIDMQSSGTVLDISNLKVAASGTASANLSSEEYTAQQFALQVSGKRAQDSFDVTLDAAKINLLNNAIATGKLSLRAKLEGQFGKVVANLELPGVEGNEQSFKIKSLALDLDVRQPEQAFKVKLNSPVTGSIQAQKINLSNLVVAVQASGEQLPNKLVNSEMQGSVQIDALKQTVQAKLAGGLLQSKLKAQIGILGFAEPAIKFDVEVDQFDADLYLPQPPATAAAAPKTEQPEQPLDLSALRTLNLDGSLRVGALKLMNVKTTQLRADVKAQKGLVNINPLSAKLYQGSMNGSLSVNAQAIPSVAIKQNLSGVDIATLSKDAADLDTLEGKGNVSMQLSMQGNTVSAMKKGLNGDISLSLVDGAIKGINLAKKLRDAKSFFGKGGATAQTQAANKEEKTDFSEMKATFKVSNGVAHNDDLSLKSPLIRVGGAGDINIGNDSIDYLAKATLVKSMEGQGGADAVGGITVPVRVKGPYTNLKYTLDFGAMVKEETKQKVEAKIETKKEEVKTKVQEQLKDKLKGLFK